jgi:predicted solute-binding protein
MTTANELRDQAATARAMAQKAADEADVLSRQARAAENAERAAKHAEIYANHSSRVFGELGYELTAKQHELIYSAAYERSHSSGFGEVEDTYSDLADLVRQCLGSASIK